MKNFLAWLQVILFLFMANALKAQDTLHTQGIKINVSSKKIEGDKVALAFNVKIPAGIHLYAINPPTPDDVGTTVSIDSTIKGASIENIKAVEEVDKDLGQKVRYYVDSAAWLQHINMNGKDSLLVKGTVNYMYKENGEFKTGEEPFRIYINAKKDATIAAGDNNKAAQSLWWIFLAGLGAGFLALLTPCIYSMIPITVSFFTKRSKSRKEGIRNAIYYSISIIAIFTGIGFLITLIFGATALNNFATNWIANLFFFAIFLLFGFSFLGAFEITLPSSWTSSSDSKAGTGNFAGIFFMALTLVLVSFSCTGPFIGTMIPLITQSGNRLAALVGFFGFSLALALPFSLFAFFPSKINSLGKAGGWLNVIKVTLGFLELALALKFLSNADLARHWRILDREVFIVLWIVIFALLGLYLLGKLKFHHDDELPKNDFGIPYISVTRLMLAIISLAFAVYLVPGLWGAPLKAASAFVPPMGTQDFIVGGNRSTGSTPQIMSHDSMAPSLPHPLKYYEQMKINEPEVVVSYGLTTYFDYQEALKIAKDQKKPLMLDFTGINCINCRKMEGSVWSDPQVLKLLKEDFVIASLYVDVHDVDLAESEVYTSAATGKKIETLGDKNSDLQVSTYKANVQPYYFFLDQNENKLIEDGYGYNPDVKKFIALLNKAKEEYKKRNP